ncbi:amidohydrolase family protein [Geomicrobium sp. JCM 19039]|uniref:amidohydrolase family protein n=1 Tax=Geomicrobium sp. JCM 19039 TaxID=1460636 RepID=UPI00045F2C2C|nr:amidohydrolase family protein [Geomicrobium sp. JCM 19039]GAK14255.1 2-amino-3-carboxymuconate-6-semialdehyde decarboxylase [Geomicrobium sp. JCM 19039]
MKGAIVGPGFGERTLADSFFDPLFEAANATQAVLFVHPLLHSDPRLNHSKLPNLIGVPWETTIAAANLIVQGVLDRYPNITFLLAHGGGFLPYQIGRMSKGFQSWENEFAKLQRTPLEYAASFYYDSVLWDERTLDYLLEIAGKNQVIPGSDFPFELNDWKIDQHKLNQTPSFL